MTSTIPEEKEQQPTQERRGGGCYDDKAGTYGREVGHYYLNALTAAVCHWNWPPHPSIAGVDGPRTIHSGNHKTLKPPQQQQVVTK